MIIKFLKNNKLLVITILLYGIVALIKPSVFKEAVGNTVIYLKQMLEILPAVFILSGLINAWVPTEVIIRNFGHESGIRGKLISLFIGSISAGPIYAAFPLTQSLLGKGASLVNVVIIISSWAVVKIPMLIVESRFLGINFAAARYVLTIPSILLIGIICEKLITREEILKSIELEKENPYHHS